MLPDPNSAQSIGWISLALFALAGGVNQILKLVDRFKGKPANSELHQNFETLVAQNKETRARVIALENWRLGLSAQLEEDKQEILDAGEKRKDELQKQINELPGKIVVDILNAQKLFRPQ